MEKGRRITFEASLKAKLEGCTLSMLPFHWPSLRHKDTYDRKVVPRKSLGMSAAVQSQEETTLAFPFDTNCWISEDLNRKMKNALDGQVGRGLL